MNPEQFFNMLREGDADAGGIRCLTMFRVEDEFFGRLKSDVLRFCAQRTPSRPAAESHVTHWTAPRGQVSQYSLLNRSGRTDDFSSDHNLSCTDKWFYDEAIAPDLGEFISAFPHLVNFRINVLGTGAELPAHKEQVIFRARNGKVAARLRFHLPIETNADSVVVVDGAVFSLQSGYVYLVHQGRVHTARNGGSSPRTHLVWDALLTARLYDFLFLGSCVPVFLNTLAGRESEPRCFEPVGSYRRLASEVTKKEAATLDLCEPQ